MAQNLKICDMDPELVNMLKKFRMRKEKNIAAIVMKIDKNSLTVVFDEEHEDISIEELQAELPPQQPRYVALSYVLNHSDGRVSYPFIFIFISPPGCSPELQMLYAGSKLTAVREGQFTKVIELRSLEDLTDETIVEKLR